MVFTRNITVQTRDIGTNVTLLFTFQPPTPGLFKDFIPLAWRVAKLAAKGNQTALVTYVNQLIFTRAQVTSGNFVSSGSWTNIDLKQATNLKADDQGTFFFDDPTPIPENNIRCTNKTKARQNISTGFNNNNQPNSVLVFKDVGNNSSVQVEFTPVLKIYISSDYQETEILRGNIQNEDPLWSQNIAGLGESTTLTLTKDAETGEYKLA
jgi:hypothetical protein